MLRAALLVETERQGKYVIHRLADGGVVRVWIQLRLLAEDRLPFACSLSLAELRSRLAELPMDKSSVVYCRGPTA